ncbi:MAG: hypothetical protein QM765_00905 [Myxococcales bacterium]
MPPSFAAALLALVTLAVQPEPVWLVPATDLACPSDAELRRALSDRLGAERVRSGAPEKGAMVVRLAKVSDRDFELRLVRHPATAVATRRLSNRDADCRESARTIALLVEGQLSGLGWSGAIPLPATAAEPEARSEKPDRREPRPIPSPSAEPSVPETPPTPPPEEPAPGTVEEPAPAVAHPAPEPASKLDPVAPPPPALAADPSSEPRPTETVQAPAIPAEPAPAIPFRLNAYLFGGGALEANGSSSAWEGEARFGVVVVPRLELLLDFALATDVGIKAGRGSISAGTQRLAILARVLILQLEGGRIDVVAGAGGSRVEARSTGFLENDVATLYRAELGVGAEAAFEVVERVDLVLSLQGWLRFAEDRLFVEGAEPGLTLGLFRLHALAGLRVKIW